MAKTRVVMNRDSFGRNVMAGAAVSNAVEAVAEKVAGRVKNGTVRMVTMSVHGGGSRVRAHVSNGTSDVDEARTNELTAALMSTVRISK